MKFSISAVLSFLLLPLFAIDAEKPMPELQVSKWYSKTKFELPELGFAAVVLFDATAADSINMLRMLDSLDSRGQNLPIAAVAINPQEQADAIIPVNGPFQTPIAVDNKLKTRNALAETESLFPYAVLAKDGKVLWSGHPTDLEAVFVKASEGKFSLSRQKEIELIRRNLQMAIQSGLPDVIASTADQILRIAPDDKIAIQAKLFAFNNKGQLEQAGKFIGEVCEKNPKDSKLRMMQLDFLLNTGNAQRYKTAAEKAFHDFASDRNAALVFLTAYVIENSPYGIMDPTLLRNTAQKAHETVRGTGTQVEAVALETLARANATNGNFTEAADLQSKALAIRKGSHLEKAAADRLDYYKKLQALRSQK